MVKNYNSTKPKYMKYITTETPFVQPVLTGYGTMGGNTFACEQWTPAGDGYPSWHMFSTSYTHANPQATGIYNNVSFKFYNPLPLKISSIRLLNNAGGGNNISSFELSGSDDNVNFTSIGTFSGLNTAQGATVTTNINATAAYKYFKFNILSSAGGINWVGAINMAIFGQEVIISSEESTKDDYDYIEHRNYIIKGV